MPSLVFDTARKDARRLTRSLGFAGFAGYVLAGWETARRHPDHARVEAARKVWKRRIGRGTLELLGVQFAREGVIPRDTRPKLIVANHRSALDIAVMLAHFDASLLSRADLEHWPVLGRLAQGGGTLFVDRDDPNSGMKAIRQMRRALQSGQSLAVFPEGTTLGGDAIEPFKPGAFAAARGLDVDVLPVGFAYSRGTEWTTDSFGAHLARVAEHPGVAMFASIGTPYRLEGRPERAAEIARENVRVLAARARAKLGEAEPGRALK